MPRLPVNPEPKQDAVPLTVRISWTALAVFAVLAIVWFFGLARLDEWLALDLTCSSEPAYGRRARYAEMVSCALGSGPRGWLWLGWSASLPCFVIFWLERALRRSIMARGQAASEQSDSSEE